MAYLRTVERRISERVVRKSIDRILRETSLASLSTVAPGGQAHIHTAYVCFSRDLEFFFLSDPRSRHVGNLRRKPSMAVTVFRSTQAWGGSDRGLQLFGTCAEARDDDAIHAARLYGARFPRYRRIMEGRTPQAKRQATGLRSYRFYRFVPTRLKILDERTFGGGVFVEVKLPRTRGKS